MEFETANYDELRLMVNVTINRIDHINKSIVFHQNLDDPDLFAVEQNRRLKKELSHDLVRLLNLLGVDLAIAA